MFTYGLLGASLVGLLGLQAGQVSGKVEGAGESQVPQVTTFEVKAEVHFVEGGYHFNLNFTGNFEDPTDFDKGVWVEGKGEGAHLQPVTSDAVSPIRNMTVRLKVSGGATGTTARHLGRGAYLADTTATPAIRMLYMRPMAEGGARILVTSPDCTTVSAFDVSRSLVQALPPEKLAGLIGEMFTLLSASARAESGGGDSLSFQECLDAAYNTCQRQGLALCRFRWEPPGTCEFDCVPQPPPKPEE